MDSAVNVRCVIPFKKFGMVRVNKMMSKYIKLRGAISKYLLSTQKSWV